MDQPHNVVRHPDMPPETFADMWATLQAGESWSALVKNRRKDGDHYWVRANATPVQRAGQTVGYMSVRTRPGRAEVEAAETPYKRLREGSARGLRLRKGILVRSGALAWMSMFKVMSVRARIRFASALAALVPMIGLWVLGLDGPQRALMAGPVLLGALLANLMLESQIAGPLARIVE